MKNESSSKMKCFVRRTTLMLCALMLFPMAAVGCESAQKIIKNRERADEVSKLAEQYMQEKYNRGFKVRKCDAAEGEEYKGDFFISFNNGVHAFYDSDEDLFYDDRQSEVINENIMRDIWQPMFKKLGVLYENINDWSQTFNMVYHYNRGGKDNRFSMYHDDFHTSVDYYAVHSKLFVTSDNLVLISDKKEQCADIYDKLREDMARYFKAQEKGELNIYVITPALLTDADFKPEELDETTQGCIAHYCFSEKRYFAVPHFSKVTDELYVNLCHKEGQSFSDGDVSLVPVDDFDSVSKRIMENMDTKDIGFIDQYISKKRKIDFENTIYQLKISSKVNQNHWEDVTLGFMMKDGDEPIEKYAELNEKEHSFFAYNLDGTEYNATCLCSLKSRSVMFNYKIGDEVYFWFGSQS